jgi:hypothetical protein
MVGTPLSEEEIRELLIKEKTCWLATVSPKGENSSGYQTAEDHFVETLNHSA